MFHKVIAPQCNLMKSYNSFPTSIEANSTSMELAINLSLHSHLSPNTATFPNIKQLAASMTVAKIARPVTVQIYTSFGFSASGVIIKKQENIYTVLTANHIIKHTDAKYLIHTHKGKNYPAMSVRHLQSNEGTYNLAIIQFSTSDFYPVATLSHTDENLINTDVFVSSYLQIFDSQQQELKLINGTIVDCPPETVRPCSRVNDSGMSGSPVFNDQGYMIGIYIAKEVEPESEIGIKTAMDINLYTPLHSLGNLRCSELEQKLSQQSFQELAIH